MKIMTQQPQSGPYNWLPCLFGADLINVILFSVPYQGSLSYFPSKITGQSYSYDTVQIRHLESYMPL